MKRLTRFKFMLWSFGKTKVPLIGYVKPKLIQLDDKKIVIKLPCSRRNRNHLNSMYFGVLTIGADLAGGFHGLYHAKQSGLNVSLAFKSFEANFIRRPESDVYFVSEMGSMVKSMIAESKETGLRVNQIIIVKAYVNYFNSSKSEEVAHFKLELSLKTNK
ncbi:MAG: hypothetical protein QNK11_07735 [Legionella sp.]|nr:hypothetical protein [Legionella sp.]